MRGDRIDHGASRSGSSPIFSGLLTKLGTLRRTLTHQSEHRSETLPGVFRSQRRTKLQRAVSERVKNMVKTGDRESKQASVTPAVQADSDGSDQSDHHEGTDTRSGEMLSVPEPEPDLATQGEITRVELCADPADLELEGTPPPDDPLRSVHPRRFPVSVPKEKCPDDMHNSVMTELIRGRDGPGASANEVILSDRENREASITLETPEKLCDLEEMR